MLPPPSSSMTTFFSRFTKSTTYLPTGCWRRNLKPSICLFLRCLHKCRSVSVDCFLRLFAMPLSPFHPHPFPSPFEGEGFPCLSIISRVVFHNFFDITVFEVIIVSNLPNPWPENLKRFKVMKRKKLIFHKWKSVEGPLPIYKDSPCMSAKFAYSGRLHLRRPGPAGRLCRRRKGTYRSENYACCREQW
jgi:hypothetical protein